MSQKAISNSLSVHALFQYAMEWMGSFCGFLSLQSAVPLSQCTILQVFQRSDIHVVGTVTGRQTQLSQC